MKSTQVGYKHPHKCLSFFSSQWKGGPESFLWVQNSECYPPCLTAYMAQLGCCIYCCSITKIIKDLQNISPHSISWTTDPKVFYFSYISYILVATMFYLHEYATPLDSRDMADQGGGCSSQSRMFLDEFKQTMCKAWLFSLYRTILQAGSLPFCSVWKTAISSNQIIFRSLLL